MTSAKISDLICSVLDSLSDLAEARDSERKPR
jgi:hypothetical protein